MRSARPFVLLAALLVALLVWPTGAGAAPALTITTADSAGATTLTARLTGFTPQETIDLQLGTTESTPRILEIPGIVIGADGSYTLSLIPLGLPAGAYTLTALRGTAVVASVRFAVTARATPTRAAATPTRAPITTVPPTAAPPTPVAPTAVAPTPPATGSGGALPGLPNTGGGAGNGPAARTWSFAVLAAFVVVAGFCIVGGLWRRPRLVRAINRLVEHKRRNAR